MADMPDARRFAPATQRNRDPILQVLQRVLPPEGTVLEISSGTGEHAVYFAPHLAPRQWLPSEPNPTLRRSITAWQATSPADNLHPPIDLDTHASTWSVELVEQPEALASVDLQQYPITAIVNINMIHIAPWSACVGLMAGAGRILPSGGILYLYGPFKVNRQHTAPSNHAFDTSLKSQNSEWGVRDLEAVATLAESYGLVLSATVEMPANNLSVIFQAK
jgi:hypothetical protein